MKRKNATRSALFTSVLALLLCVSMLVGTTFAWFTDTVVSGNNVIAAGNLDITLLNNGSEVKENTNLFADVLWEPGVVVYENLTIRNDGNLALLYDFAINWGEYNTLNGRSLNQILKVAMVDGHITGDRGATISAGKNAGWKELEKWSFGGELDKKGDKKDFALIIYWEPSDKDNDYNVQNGNMTNDGKPLYINLGIELKATQKMYENDSFGKDYDALANAWNGTAGTLPGEDNGVITITTGAELAAFAAAVNNGNSFSGKTVQLGADIDLGNKPWTPIGDCRNSKYFRGTFDGQGHTVYNLSVDRSDDTSEYTSAGLFGWVDAAGATVKNVKLENATVLGSHWVGGIAGYWTGRIENCSVSNSTIMGFNVNGEANGDKVGGIVGYLNADSYINNNSVTNTEITGNRDIGGIVGAVAATIDQMNNNKVTNTTIYYNTAKSYASAGEIVSGRTGYVADNTNIATNVTIVHVINVKTVAELNAALAALSGDALNTAAILQNCNEPSGVVQIPADYTGILTLKDSTIGSVQAAGKASIVIAGTVKVDASALENTSAITGVELYISGNGKLTAIANGLHAHGIGGENTEKITIENVYIVDVKGGIVQPQITTSWGKNEDESGTAIGSGKNGAVITLNNVTIDNAQGGSKAAGIGGRHWTGVTVNITNSIIKNVQGGNGSAGIGGSRVSNNATTAESVTINIVNSNITSIGGDYGAGIGSGYTSYLHAEAEGRPLYTINIDETSVINATGGVAAAGIGTGHNVVGLAGEIKSQNVTAKAGKATCPAPNVDCCYDRARTDAQDIGFGSVADLALAAPVTKLLTYRGEQIAMPAAKVSTSAQLTTAVSRGVTNLWLNDGVYSIDGCGSKTLTISGTEKAVIKPVNEGEWGCDYGFDSTTVVFNGITIDTTEMTTNAYNQTPNYPGFARINATYNNCIIKGTYALNKDAAFTNCKFFVEGDKYNVWTWGATKASFTECTFNCDGKSILVYNNSCDLTVQKCAFNDNGTISGKAAIETGVDNGSTVYNITVTECQFNGFDVTGQNAVTYGGTSLGTTVWGNKNLLPDANLNVTVDGIVEY